MKAVMKPDANCVRPGFTLVEVILAVGVLSLAILSLVGLFTPILGTVRAVSDNDESAGIVSFLDVAFQSKAVMLEQAGNKFDFDAISAAAVSEANQYVWVERPLVGEGFGAPRMVLSDSKPDETALENLEGAVFVFTLRVTDPNWTPVGAVNIPIGVRVYRAEPSVFFSGTDFDPTVAGAGALLADYEAFVIR